MKAKAISTKDLSAKQDQKLLSLVADKLKDRELFPEKIARAKAFLKKAKFR